MKKNFYLQFSILLCVILILSYIAVYTIKKEKTNTHNEILINKTALIYEKISAILISKTSSSNEQIQHYIKTILNSYLKKEKDFSFYHISSLENGMFIPHTIGKKENTNMIMINLNDLKEDNTENDIIQKGNFTIFYKKLYFKDNPIFLSIAFNKISFLNTYIHIFSANTSLMILAFFILKSLRKTPPKQKDES